MHAGVICKTAGIPLPALSFYLAHLSRMGPIIGRQESRFIFYAADGVPDVVPSCRYEAGNRA